MRVIPFLPLLFLAACHEPEQPRDAAAAPAVTASGTDPVPGCYLAHLTNSADSILLNLETAGNGRIRGQLRLAIAGKDARNGALDGVRGADGVIRAVYRFMQEGVRDSVRLQLRHGDGPMEPMELRPSAYDPVTGREYPDSSKPFSILLQPVPCPE